MAEHDGEKWCNKCEKWHPATTEYFYRDSDAKDGLQAPCKPCRKVYDQERIHKRKKGAAATGAGGAATPPAEGKRCRTRKGGSRTAETPIQDEPLTITLEFDSYPHVLEKIKEIARTELRSAENQVLWWLTRNIEHLDSMALPPLLEAPLFGGMLCNTETVRKSQSEAAV